MPEVVLINPFEVPVGADEQFLAAWRQARDSVSAHPGYRRTRLHRSLAPSVDFRIVNLAVWESAEAFGQAMAAAGITPAAFPFRGHPALYEVVPDEELATVEGGGVILINAFEVPPSDDDAFMAAWRKARDFLAEKPG